MARCESCGAELPPGADVCPGCGVDRSVDLGHSGGQEDSAPVPEPVDAAPPVTPAPPVAPAPEAPALAPTPEPPAPTVAPAPMPPIPPVAPTPPTYVPPVAPTPQPQAPPAAPAPVQPVSPEASAPPPPPAALHVKRGGLQTGDVFLIGDRVVIGRYLPETGPVDVDLTALPESMHVSGRHAYLCRDAAGTWYLEDLRAPSGTFVRRSGEPGFQRVTGRETVGHGDEIALGQAQLLLVVR